MKSGTVKNYNADRGFGFIKIEDGKDVFFHIKNGKYVNAGKSKPELSFRNTKCTPDPKAGDRLMFEVIQGQKGLVADPWCLAEDWKRAEQEIASRPSDVAQKTIEKVAAIVDVGQQAHEGKAQTHRKDHKKRMGREEERQTTRYKRETGKIYF